MSKLNLESRVEDLEHRLQMLANFVLPANNMELFSAAEQEGERDDGQGQQEPEQPKPLLTGPCIAKTRTRDIVPVYRGNRNGCCFQYLIESIYQTVSEDGKYWSDKYDHLCDIVEVIRPLTDQEVLDWQFRGIEPELTVASEPVAKGFEHSDIGRKEAEAIGLVYLGKTTGESIAPIGNCQFYEFSSRSKEWSPALYISPFRYYAFKPNSTQ